MPEASADRLGVLPFGHKPGGVTVAQVVEPNEWQVVAADETRKP
jgi:hypothetical protein